LSPKINNETRITLQLEGKAIALGRGNLTEIIKKVLRLTKYDAVFTFIELNHYAFPINNQRDSGNII
jgi:hypothetical protein